MSRRQSVMGHLDIRVAMPVPLSHLRTFESIDVIEFSQDDAVVYLAVCSTFSTDEARETYQVGPQLFRWVLALDGALQPHLWSFLPERLVSSDILIARTSRDHSTLRCMHCREPSAWLCRLACQHHCCDGCASPCPGTFGTDTSVDLHVEGHVLQLTSWVTWDLPDRLPLAEVVSALRQPDARTAN